MALIESKQVDRLMPQDEVEKRVNLSGPTIHRLRKKRMFPEPIKIGLKRIAYWESEVECYLATRDRASYPGEAA